MNASSESGLWASFSSWTLDRDDSDLRADVGCMLPQRAFSFKMEGAILAYPVPAGHSGAAGTERPLGRQLDVMVNQMNNVIFRGATA